MKQLQQAGFTNHEDFTSSKEEIEAKIHNYKASSSAADSKSTKHSWTKPLICNS
jgi:hypothetical protein